MEMRAIGTIAAATSVAPIFVPRPHVRGSADNLTTGVLLRTGEPGPPDEAFTATGKGYAFSPDFANSVDLAA
jgi:hypothetical protein